MSDVAVVPIWKSIGVKFERKYPGYVYRREIIDDREYGGDGNLEVVACYSRDSGCYIGNARDARNLCIKRGLTRLEKTSPSHCVCSIGFNEQEQKWYGWSHRAICGFGVGDKIFDDDFGNDQTPFIEHGKKTIKTLTDAKLSAKRFAASVS